MLCTAFPVRLNLMYYYNINVIQFLIQLINIQKFVHILNNYTEWYFYITNRNIEMKNSKCLNNMPVESVFLFYFRWHFYQYQFNTFHTKYVDQTLPTHIESLIIIRQSSFNGALTKMKYHINHSEFMEHIMYNFCIKTLMYYWTIVCCTYYKV